MESFKMNRILISCDEYVYSYKDLFYVRRFGRILLDRYLNVFDTIVLVVRVKHVDSSVDLKEFNIPLRDNRIGIHPIPFFQGPIQYAQQYFKIRRVLKTIPKCDAAIFRLPSTVGFAVLDRVKKTSTPYAVEVVFSPIDFVKNTKNLIEWILWKNIHLYQKEAVRNAVGVSYVTEQALQRDYPPSERSFSSFYSSIELTSSFFGSKREFPVKNPWVICHVADPIQGDRKGHAVVIKIIKSLRDSNVDVIAKFAGAGDSVEHFENMAKDLNIHDSIKFAGRLNKEQLVQFLKDSHLMILPSEAEGLPRAIIEAMAQGLPCLSTPVSGIPELLPDELLFKKDDIDGFCNRLLEIFASPRYYEELSLRSLTKAKEFRKDNLDRKRNDFFLKLRNLIK